MPHKSKPTWIAVMDGARVRFFALRRGEEGRIFEETAPPLLTKPRRWAREAAGALDGALADRRYDRLVLVAPPRLLAELREQLSERVRETLVHQVPKNFVKLGAEALWQKLSVILLEAAAANGARVATVSGNAMPVSVVFRNLAATPTVQGLALKQAARLGRKFGRIRRCRVTVEAPHHVHHKVKEFRIAVELKLPGCEIAAKHASGDGPSFDNIGTVLRQAFATAERQLQDHVHRRKGATVRTRKQTSPRQRGLAEA